jgi:hypothetical protein
MYTDRAIYKEDLYAGVIGRKGTVLICRARTYKSASENKKAQTNLVSIILRVLLHAPYGNLFPEVA